MAPRSPTPRGASAIRQANLREHNLGLVLRIIVDAADARSREPTSRRSTGLTRATVSSLVDALIEAGAGHRTAAGACRSAPAGPRFRWCRRRARRRRWAWRSTSTTSACA